MKKVIPILSLLTLLASSQALAADKGACNVQSTSRMDALLNPAKASDERFFSAPSGPPNILIALDTSTSMRWWPMSWRNDDYYSYSKNAVPDTDPLGNPKLPGCRQENVNALGYDPNVAYPQLWKSIGDSTNPVKTRSAEFFHPDKWYFFDGMGDTGVEDWNRQRKNFGINYEPVPFFGNPGSTSFRFTDVNLACQKVYNNDPVLFPIPADVLNACKQCMQEKGYFQYASDRRVADGNFLNFYSPRGHTAVSVLTQVIDESPTVRFAMTTFSHANHLIPPAGYVKPGYWGWQNQPTPVNPPDAITYPDVGITMMSRFGPACGDSYSAQKLQDHRNSIIQKMQYLRFNVATPLSEMLYTAAHYFRSSKGPTDPFADWFGAGGFQTDPDFNDEAAPGAASVCTSCSFNAVVLLTDGEPVEWSDPALPFSIRNLPTPCDGCGPFAALHGSPSTNTKSHVHRVADWMWNHDMRTDLPGIQRVATYTVAFAFNEALVIDQQAIALMRATANAGGGKFYQATHSVELKKKLLSIIDDVQSRNLSFSASAIASFQTSGSELSALLPRMIPSSDGKPWQGRLFRFNQFNEFVEETTDKNEDGDYTDILLVDADGDVVVEQGPLFIKKKFSSGAKHFWEASEVLQQEAYIDTTGAHPTVKGRNIYTILDKNNDGRFATEDKELVEFTATDPATFNKLKDYLGVAGTTACPYYTAPPVVTLKFGSIFAALGLDVTRAASLLNVTMSAPPYPANELDDLCTRVLIEYVRGMDFSGTTVTVRSGLLGDIFHSSPLTVEPPVDKFLCDLGIHNQCVRTLYSQSLNGVPATPLDTQKVNRCGKEVELDAYEAYVHNNRLREKLVLVGANDGMLHAFVDSVAAETCTGDLPFVTYSAARTPPTTARSPGREMWAFIPPDLLPRLQEMTQGHTYYVDGDIMVRDVWADGSGSKTPTPNGKKEWDEFHTMAVVAEGRGGVHYFALELTADPLTGKFTDKPTFQWMYPQPDSAEAALFGKTLYSLTPKAPPIGPVLVEATNGAGISRYGVSTEERWTVMLSGGWSPGLDKGRGIYLVDAYHPTVNGRTDNLWWKFDYNPNASGEQETPRKYLTHSVVAPVAMVDYGRNGAHKLDGFFDTGIFGDTRGQLWVARFSQPGKLSTASPKMVENWAAARAFQMDRDGGDSVRQTWPIHYLPAIGIQPDNGLMRAMIGTGNRYALLDGKAGVCRYDNPDACAKVKCGTVEVESKLDRIGAVVTTGQKWLSDVHDSATLSLAGSAATECGTPLSTVATGEITKHDVLSCSHENASGTTTENYPNVRRTKVLCGMDANSRFACRVVDPPVVPENYKDIVITPKTSLLDSVGKNRFFGVRIYGAQGQMFDESLNTPSASVLTAASFDAQRLSDRTSANGVSGDLVDVTNTTCDALGNCTGNKAQAKDAGWMIEYSGILTQKTASGASIVSSCSLWNAMYPYETITACASTVAKNRFYQANFITGEPNCATSMNGDRFKEADVMSPPSEPTPTVQVSKSGKISISSVRIPSGGGGTGTGEADKIDIAYDDDMLQSVYELPMSPAQHACRHEDMARCAALMQ